MKNIEVTWRLQDEATYLEERKNTCEHCQPSQEETIAWLESTSVQDIIHTAFTKYGIHPKDIYREFEAEFAGVYTAEEIEVFMQELAV